MKTKKKVHVVAPMVKISAKKALIILNTMVLKLPTSQIGGGLAPNEPKPVTRYIPGDAEIVGADYANSSLPIQVTRNSYNIPNTALPYVLFCPDAQSTNFATVFADSQTLPTGVTCTVSIFNNRALRFTFNDGVNPVDTVDVTTQFPVPYPVIMAMIAGGDWFVSDKLQQSVGSNYNAQFNTVSMSFGQLAFNGFKGSNAIPLSNAKSPFQYQLNIIDVFRRFTFNSRRYLVMLMAASAPNPGDESIVNDFQIDQYHSTRDFTGPVVSSFKTTPMELAMKGI